ncbi:PREDICTED: lymphocyte antigen 6C2-like [Capra hircus]|uniref:lymphocyte antigen 6C2-like n=1 Tax=Capra hircus TaxID=9925 RepID=UPI0008472F44|nr:PREDICTED: lymphocyte antigen 6C2-like [Capra hircus]
MHEGHQMLARQKESEATEVMKGPLLILLVLMLCAELAQSLRCYSCGTLGKFSVPNHCPTSECDSNSTVCYTGNLSMIVEADMIELDIRGCVSSCQMPTEFIKRLIATSKAKFEEWNVICCEKDLCNGWSEQGPTPVP